LRRHGSLDARKGSQLAARHIDEGRTMMHMGGMLAALGPLQVLIGDEHGRNALEPTASHATSGSNRGRRLAKVHRATEWLKPSFARSSASASVRDQMPKPSCVSCQLGSPTTTRFTRTRLSDIVHPVSSSQLTQDPDCVRTFGGYNNSLIDCVN
jgi:hypothetical protein